MKLAALSATVLLFAQSGADKNPGHLKMGLVSLKCVTSAGTEPEANKANIQSNLKRHVYFIERLAAEGVEFVGFPELSINGYNFSNSIAWLSLTGPEVGMLQQAAVGRKVYVAAGLAEVDSAGRKWNTHLVIDPKGKIVGVHHKIWLTKEKGFVDAGADHNVFEVKGLKMGMIICADGTDRNNLQSLVDKGAKLIYAPHANTTGGTTAGWFKFRSAWAGPDGWIAQMKVTAALHNHAGYYNPQFQPPVTGDAFTGWASGAWFIGPDGQTLAQMPSSTQKNDSKEFVLIHNVPIGKR